ncbi:MAG: PadR family transcriptional regulator [Candidatus Heimdallarchaeota archaeon]|nr:PadR family transcriptional regulator [Candidatus Heimdallarchaeota archaeon]MCK4769096.1 PadR family transcriptional regulator [Candidatus Heimdallarchaeota archaeon]
MLKNVKTFNPTALITDHNFRNYLENFESELLRGISTIVILEIVQGESDGVYGYQLMKLLEERTDNMLVLEEGTVYPILRKMEKDGLLRSLRKGEGGRSRNYYFVTDEGEKLFNHMTGFFSKLLEAIAPLLKFQIKLPKREFIFCPNCTNRIKTDVQTNYCEVCGFYVGDYLEGGRK